ncbi:hypothetical protein Tco_0362508, partial [Tanacetum coccineum]
MQHELQELSEKLGQEQEELAAL